MVRAGDPVEAYSAGPYGVRRRGVRVHESVIEDTFGVGEAIVELRVAEDGGGRSTSEDVAVTAG